MKKKITEKIHEYLNESFREDMVNALKAKFGDLGFETRWNLIAGNLQTNWTIGVGKKKFIEIETYVKTYEQAYIQAMNRVYNYKREN